MITSIICITLKMICVYLYNEVNVCTIMMHKNRIIGNMKLTSNLTIYIIILDKLII